MSSVERIAQEILYTQRLALGHATTPQLTSSAVNGGGIDFTDAEGNRIGGLGLGDDGGFVIDYSGGPKPPKPSPPVVTADGGIFRIEWDGAFVNEGDEGLLATSDCDRVEVHASMDENFVPDRVESYGGAFASLDGGSFALGPLPEAGTYYFRLVARSKSNQYSEPSDRVEQELAIAEIDLAINDAWLVGEAAQNTADGKNSIWRGPDEPEPDEDAPFKDGDIWFEMTEDGKSIPNIWDEAAGAWVGNDDYRQSEIEKVQQELREDLDNIVIDGSGTKNFYQSEEPTEGMREGDLWFDVSDKNKPYIYHDGEWITVRDSFTQPGAGENVFALLTEVNTTKNALDNQWASVPGFSFTIGSTGVEATVPAGAEAGTVTARLPLAGSFNSAGEWQITAEDTIPSNGLGLGATGQLGFYSPGAAPTARIVLKVSAPGQGLLEVVQPLDVKEDKFGSTRTHSMSLQDQDLQVLGLYPAVYAWSLFLEVTVDSVPGNTISGSLQIAYAVGGQGVADKAITTSKIAAGAITAESGIIGSINAGTITVGEMDGARIKAGTVDADTVLVESSIGSTLIKDGAILTDHIAAGSITADSGIIGSIDANVITVGKIMGNQLDADAINGKTITGATIRTASSGSRVELTRNGLKQYNSLGATIVDMTAGSFALEGGSITGSTIKTATSGSRVEITTQGLKQFNADEEVIAEMVDGSMVMKGVLEQENSFASMQVGTAFASTVSPGVRWMNVGGTEKYAGIATNGSPGNAAVVVQGPRETSSDTTEPYGYLSVSENASTLTYRADGSTASRRSYVSLFEDEFNLISRRGTSSAASWIQGSASGNYFTWHGSSEEQTSFLSLKPNAYDLRSYGASGDMVSGLWADTSATKLSAYKRDLELWGGEGARMVMTTTGSNPRVRSTTIYNTTSSGGAVGVNDAGTLYRITSSARYKQDIADAAVNPSILDVTPRVWRDRGDVEAAEELEAFREEVGEGPAPYELAEAKEEPLWRYGAIAEEVHDLGLTELVEYDQFGRPDALDYGKFGVALIPIVRELRDRIVELESMIGN